MVGIKVVIANPKNGKSIQKELSEENSQVFYGKKIGEVIHGELLDFTGYEFKITGGSDYCGFPMRQDIQGAVRRRILAVSSTGVKPYKYKVRKNKPFQFHPGSRLRKTVCGNTIHEKIVQVNLVLLKEGATPLIWEKTKESDKEGIIEKKEK